MDLAIVGALIVGHELTAKADLSLPQLMGPGGMEPAQLNAPKQVASKASLVRGGRNWTIACGGVQINPWEIVYHGEVREELAALRSKISFADRSQWWSN
jgi:hypothetical protein